MPAPGPQTAPPASRRARLTLAELWRARRLRLTREGWYYVLFTIGVGAAALNTGNNLLFLVLGLQLTAILVSGTLSDLTLHRLEVERDPPSDTPAGDPLVVRYRIHNRKRLWPSYALRVAEKGGPLAGRGAVLLHVPPKGSAEASASATVARRGRYPLRLVTVSTRFPFGLFEKSQDFAVPGELWVLPARSVAGAREVSSPGSEGIRPSGRAGEGSELFDLRELRPGDDRRRVHWRKSAAAGRLLVVERERERKRRVLLVVENRGVSEQALERAVRQAAALARRYAGQDMEVGLSASALFLAPRAGPRPLRLLLRALAEMGVCPADAPAPETRGDLVPVRAWSAP